MQFLVILAEKKNHSFKRESCFISVDEKLTDVEMMKEK